MELKVRLPKKCYWCGNRIHFLPYNRLWCNALKKKKLSIRVIDIALKQGDILMEIGQIMRDYPEHKKQIRQELLSHN